MADQNEFEEFSKKRIQSRSKQAKGTASPKSKSRSTSLRILLQPMPFVDGDNQAVSETELRLKGAKQLSHAPQAVKPSLGQGTNFLSWFEALISPRGGADIVKDSDPEEDLVSPRVPAKCGGYSYFFDVLLLPKIPITPVESFLSDPEPIIGIPVTVAINELHLLVWTGSDVPQPSRE